MRDRSQRAKVDIEKMICLVNDSISSVYKPLLMHQSCHSGTTDNSGDNLRLSCRQPVSMQDWIDFQPISALCWVKLSLGGTEFDETVLLQVVTTSEEDLLR